MVSYRLKSRPISTPTDAAIKTVLYVGTRCLRLALAFVSLKTFAGFSLV
jgi:hypothetical protein